MDADRLLEGLSDAQRRAVTTPVVPLCIHAGAGSGKTRVLTRRIAHRAATGEHDPQRVLALTFTRKAAGELRSRLRQLGLRDAVAAGTFHSVAYAQLRARWADRGITPPTLLERKAGLVARLIPRGARAPSGREATTLDVVGEIEWAKARLIAPDRYPAAARDARRTPPLDPAALARVYEGYETTKREQRMVDFDDLLRLCARDLDRDPEFAAAQRWRFRHLFVDEYQDVNPLQQALLDAWLGDRTDLCVVGDPNQAIYAWNGADAGLLEGFTERWQGGEVVSLTDNYRSSPQILAVANAVLAGGADARRAARRGRPPVGLTAHRPDGPIPTVTAHDDDLAEARAVARAVRDRHRPGTSWSAQAVLVRTNAQTALLAEALHDAGIPHRVRGGGSLLERPEVAAAVRELRATGAPFATALADLRTDALPEHDERRANVEALVRLGLDYAALDPSPTVAGFVSWLTQVSRGEGERGGDAVDLTTFHAAKGLEWPVVHLAGLEQGLVPIGRATTPAQQAEERRLLYVAVTRAERELVLTWARQRTFGTKVVARDRSLYLDEVDVALAALRDGEGGPVAPSADIGAERRRLADRRSRPGADPDEDGLLHDLQGWRASVARGASVAPHVVFHDATLASIARARPRTVDDLLAVGGVGPVKAGRYGEAILAVVARHR